MSIGRCLSFRSWQKDISSIWQKAAARFRSLSFCWERPGIVDRPSCRQVQILLPIRIRCSYLVFIEMRNNNIKIINFITSFDSCASQCPSPPLTMWMFPSRGGYFIIVTFIASVSQCVRVCMYVCMYTKFKLKYV